MSKAEKYIRYYNRLNGKLVTREKIQDFHDALKKDIDSRRIDRFMPFGIECIDVLKKLKRAIPRITGTVKIKVDKISLNQRHTHPHQSPFNERGELIYGLDKPKEDRSGNYIGDGSYHIEPEIIDLTDFPQVSFSISYSQSTESTYVTYVNLENDKKVTVRFSEHESNAIKFGDQLDGRFAGKNEILYRLGLKERKFIPAKYLFIHTTQVKKSDLNKYENADKTIQELYALGAGADISEYAGKLAKGSNYLILGKSVEEQIKTKVDTFGNKVQVGEYVYIDKNGYEEKLKTDQLDGIITGLEYNPAEAEETGLGFTQSGQQKIYDMVTDMILDAMKQGNLFWRKTWGNKKSSGSKTKGGDLVMEGMLERPPMNYVSKKVYRGINYWILRYVAPAKMGYTNHYYVTFKQATELGGTVKKGAKGWPVVYWSVIYKYNGKNITEEEYRNLPEIEKLKAQKIPFIQYYNVFNGSDIEGVPGIVVKPGDKPEPAPVPDEKPDEKPEEFTPIESAQAIVDGMPLRPEIKHSHQLRAYYQPGHDFVHMPHGELFDKEQEYYSTLFHELVHSTGAPKRLNREFGRKFGDKKYAYEELIAELGASYLCADAGILYFTLNNSAAYLKSWSSKLIKNMQDDNKFFLRAAAAAQRAADFIHNHQENNQPEPEKPKEKKEQPEKPTEQKQPATVTNNESCAAQDLPINQINTDTARFQNRQDAFSEASANSVAMHYDPNKFDPIVVWNDPKAKKIFVLSGHSRYEGMKRRGSKTVPARFFEGTEDEAIKFAKVEANRAATQESLIEDLAAYKLMRDGDESRGIKKLNKSELARVFKGKAQKLEAYSNLNSQGLFVQALSQSNTSNYPYLERNAQWIGQLRNDYPVISNVGEDNIFHFFYSDKAGRNLKMTKDDFFKLAKRKINQLGKDESVLFPECSTDGCKQSNDKESDPQKGEAYRRLREINETLESIKEKLTSKNSKIRVSTEEEKKYLRSTGEKLQAEKEKILRDLDMLDKTQASLFGTQVDAFDIKPVKKQRGPLNRLQVAQLKDSIAAGATTKVNWNAKPNATKQPAPLFDEPINDPAQTRLFGARKRKSNSGLAGLASASDLAGINFYTHELSKEYKRDFHKLNSDSNVMIWGQPGHGKTVYLLRMAQYFAGAGKKVLYISEEEFGKSTFAEKLRTFNIGHDNLKFAGHLDESVLDYFDIIFFDSINSLQLTSAQVKEIDKRHPNKTFVLIVQTTKEGDFRGGRDWEHLVDIAGEIRNRKLILRKNRLDPDFKKKADKLMIDDLVEEKKQKEQIKKLVKQQTEPAEPVKM